VRPRVRVELLDLAITEYAKAGYPFDPRQHRVGLIVEAIVTGLEAVLACSGVNPAAVLGIGVPGMSASRT
jgi:ribulose kinase